ncbi:MAG: SpoIIIAH-like family protein, partial [Firmicutes bacterium]|nr:SpoIIIAH-like family protein [Candidatus Caballimonas caccae]
IIGSSDITSTEYSEALSKKTNIALLSEKEMLCETLIKAYGFEDAVVVIGLDSENVNVIAKTENLTSDDAILIYTIIQEENIASPENVKIIPIY